jgi:parallel beta-helix repeat protein
MFQRGRIYYEHVLVDKSISLIGENSETTIIDGGGVGTVVKVVADNVTLSRFTARNGGGELSDNAVLLHSVRDCRISGNKFTNSRTGIWIVDSYDCNITENYAENNIYGINPHNSGSIELLDNIARNNTHGILIENAPDCVLRNNTMTANKYNFRVESGLIDLDTSNTVDGKLVYYFANQQNLTITQQVCPNAGYLAVINSTGTTIRDLSVENEGQGILLQSTDRSSIQNVTVASSYFGIYLGNSQYNSIIETG